MSQATTAQKGETMQTELNALDQLEAINLRLQAEQEPPAVPAPSPAYNPETGELIEDIDGFLVSPTGHIVGNSRLPLEIDGKEAAELTTALLHELDANLVGIRAERAAKLQRLNDYFDHIEKVAESRRQYIIWMYWLKIKAWAKLALGTGKERTLHLIGGDVQLRHLGPSIKFPEGTETKRECTYTQDQAVQLAGWPLLRWCIANCPDAIKVSYTVQIKAVQNMAKPGFAFESDTAADGSASPAAALLPSALFERVVERDNMTINTTAGKTDEAGAVEAANAYNAEASLKPVAEPTADD